MKYNIDKVSFEIYGKANQVVGRWFSSTGYERNKNGLIEEELFIEFLESIAGQKTKSTYKDKAQEMLNDESWKVFTEENEEKKISIRPSRKSKTDLEDDIIDLNFKIEDLEKQLRWLLKTNEQYNLFKEKWKNKQIKVDR